MEPENGAFRDSLGWAYFKLGDLDEAIVELERAAELMPSDSEIREHLGEVYLKKGGDFVEKAVLEWEKALEMKPKNTALQQRLSELRRSLGQTENTEGGTEGTKER
jgi:tetratricopeptide (TPR) repeat protein